MADLLDTLSPDEDALLMTWAMDLQSEDAAVRYNCACNMTSVAREAGAEMTRAVFFPLLEQLIASSTGSDFDIMVVAMIAERLGDFTNSTLVGGPAHAEVPLKLLEHLVVNENDVIRGKAVATLAKFADDFSTKQFDDTFMPLFLRLAHSTDNGAAQRSSIRFYRSVLVRSKDHSQPDILSLYSATCSSNFPELRQEAAAAFSQIIGVTHVEHLSKHIIPIFDKLVRESEAVPGIRSELIKAAKTLCKLLTEHNKPGGDVVKRAIFQFAVTGTMNDRLMILDSIVDIKRYLKTYLTDDDMKFVFENFFLSTDEELRTESIRRFPSIVRKLSTLKGIGPTITQLVKIMRSTAAKMSSKQRMELVQNLLVMQTVIAEHESIADLIDVLSEGSLPMSDNEMDAGDAQTNKENTVGTSSGDGPQADKKNTDDSEQQQDRVEEQM